MSKHMNACICLKWMNAQSCDGAHGAGKTEENFTTRHVSDNKSSMERSCVLPS